LTSAARFSHPSASDDETTRLRRARDDAAFDLKVRADAANAALVRRRHGTGA
jgi:hypothetical protein